MSFPVAATLVAFLLTGFCALVIARRSSNWRIRMLALTVGLLPLCQSVILLSRHGIWVSQDIARIGDALELLVSALCLTSVHLLSRENRDRRKTDANTRLVEAELPMIGKGFSEPNRR